MNIRNKALPIASFAAALLGLLVPAVAQHTMSDALTKELAAAKRAGLTVSLKDLQAQTPPPDQNASLLYIRMKRLDKTKPFSGQDDRNISGFGSQRFPDAQHVAAARSALARRSDVLALIHQAAVRPRCVFVYDRMDLHTDPFEDRAMMRLSARWLATESYLMLLDGKPLDAVRNQALGFRIAHQAADDPDFTSRLSADSMDRIASSGMERILYTKGDDPRVAEAVAQALAKESRPLPYDNALDGDLVQGLIQLRQIPKSDPRFQEAGSRFLDQITTEMVHQIRVVAEALKRPYLEAVTRIQGLTPSATTQSANAVMFSVFIAMPAQGAQAQAGITELRTAAALLVWKAKHSAFPTTLSEALSPVPTDPFNGQPLGYRREGDGFVVYSVGETGHFDGGTPNAKPDPKEALFRYPKSAYLK